MDQGSREVVPEEPPPPGGANHPPGRIPESSGARGYIFPKDLVSTERLEVVTRGLRSAPASRRTSGQLRGRNTDVVSCWESEATYSSKALTSSWGQDLRPGFTVNEKQREGGWEREVATLTRTAQVTSTARDTDPASGLEAQTGCARQPTWSNRHAQGWRRPHHSLQSLAPLALRVQPRTDSKARGCV